LLVCVAFIRWLAAQRKWSPCDCMIISKLWLADEPCWSQRLTTKKNQSLILDTDVPSEVHVKMPFFISKGLSNKQKKFSCHIHSYVFSISFRKYRKKEKKLFSLIIKFVNSLCSSHYYVNSLCCFCVSIIFYYTSTLY